MLWVLFFSGIRAQVAAVEQSSVAAGEAKDLEGPVVVVTGASRGIGRAIALALGKSGCKVSAAHCFFSSEELFLMLVFKFDFF